jgi:hypothetical protein
MRYDLHLLDHYGRLLASEPFWAENDQGAVEVGSTVLQACCDIATTFEVRRNKGLVEAGRCECGLLSRREVTDRWQAVAIDLVNRLYRGFTAVARSRRLVWVTYELRRRGLL